jgi:hypothetical protein
MLDTQNDDSGTGPQLRLVSFSWRMGWREMSSNEPQDVGINKSYINIIMRLAISVIMSLG